MKIVYSKYTVFVGKNVYSKYTVFCEEKLVQYIYIYTYIYIYIEREMSILYFLCLVRTFQTCKVRYLYIYRSNGTLYITFKALGLLHLLKGDLLLRPNPFCTFQNKMLQEMCWTLPSLLYFLISLSCLLLCLRCYFYGPLK